MGSPLWEATALTTEENQRMTPGTRSFLERGRAEIARQGGVCMCGEPVLIGWIGDVGDNFRVAVCRTGEHVTVGVADGAKVFVHVENPGDVIETAACTCPDAYRYTDSGWAQCPAHGNGAPRE